MRYSRFLAAAALMAAGAGNAAHADDGASTFRPPAVPLVASNPFLSIWSEADNLTDDATRHWTHHEHSLVSLIRIDGKTYRLMGNDPQDQPAFPQVGVQVLPTRSIYNFEGSGVHVTLTFMTPTLPHDLDVLTRPVTYLTWDVRATDSAKHTVSLYDSTSSQLAVNTPDQKVEWIRGTMGPLTAMRVGTPKQSYFDISGDDARLDWGYASVAAPTKEAQAANGGDQKLIQGFIAQGTLPATDDMRKPRAVSDDQPVMAFAFPLGSIGAETVSRHMMVAYDEVYAIKYFGKNLRPYWRRNGATPSDLFQTAEREYLNLTQRCVDFDTQLMADMTKVGGGKYADMGALAYRQCLAATGIAADQNKKPLLFTKENNSNGDIATVDVIFPMDPMLILFSPTLAKASIVPILEYAASSHWKFPNAPHDLGTYPVARGTDDGGEGMPVEESGNMILICDAIAREDGNPKFVARWWPKITQWAQYLEKYGNDPEDQLCTDDFMGHLAHNANLSVKAILALAAYGDLCRMRGDTRAADRYQSMARGFARHWMQVASDGDHSRLAFDQPNTWSQKYNLVWDKILNLNVFPPSVARQEIAHYKSVLQPYGVPLDSRTHLTKSDWSLWSATLADNQQDFETLINPIHAYLNATTARLPFADSYVTDNIKSAGMNARPVIGGIFVKMLADPAMWKKWSSGDRTQVAGWASLPPPPVVTYAVPTSQQAAATWQYTFDKPESSWTTPGFDASAWKEGKGGFGGFSPGGVNTPWHTPDIWLRRTLTMPAGRYPNLEFMVYHDEDIEIYINGVPAAAVAGFNSGYEPLAIEPAARALLTPGATVTLAVHVHQTIGGQGVDLGLANVAPR